MLKPSVMNTGNFNSALQHNIFTEPHGQQVTEAFARADAWVPFYPKSLSLS